MLFRNVIREIQSEYDQPQWYRSVTNAALYMAIGGFLDEANRLLKELWKHNLPHDRNTWLPDRAFEMLWNAAGKRPDNVPFEKNDIDELEKEHRDYILPPFGTSWFPNIIPDYIKGEELAKTTDDKLPDSKIEKQALELLMTYFSNTEEKNSYDVCKKISLVTELAAKNNKNEIAIELLKQWSPFFIKYPYQSSVVLIGCNRHLAPLLLDGIIAEELKLNSDICNAFVNDAVEAIDYRIRNRSKLVFENLNWTELIKKLSGLAIDDAPDLFTEEQKLRQWIGNIPATIENVENKEKQLGIKLPDDYKDFLLVSNGLPQFSIIQPALSPVEEIDILRTSSLIAYGKDEIFEITKTYPGKDDEEDFGELVESALAISRMPDESEVWLIPPRQDNANFECWEFSASNPGENRYKNFRFYIEWHIQFLENETFSK